MRALVYHGLGQKTWEEVPDPESTDLHILRGHAPVAITMGLVNTSSTPPLRVVLSR